MKSDHIRISPYIQKKISQPLSFQIDKFNVTSNIYVNNTTQSVPFLTLVATSKYQTYAQIYAVINGSRYQLTGEFISGETELVYPYTLNQNLLFRDILDKYGIHEFGAEISNNTAEVNTTLSILTFPNYKLNVEYHNIDGGAYSSWGNIVNLTPSANISMFDYNWTVINNNENMTYYLPNNETNNYNNTGFQYFFHNYEKSTENYTISVKIGKDNITMSRSTFVQVHVPPTFSLQAYYNYSTNQLMYNYSEIGGYSNNNHFNYTIFVWNVNQLADVFVTGGNGSINSSVSNIATGFKMDPGQYFLNAQYNDKFDLSSTSNIYLNVT